jgi:polyisoprenoid-binding protein YceI
MRLFVIPAALLIGASTAAFASGSADPSPGALAAGTYVVEPNHTRVQFSVSYMGFTVWYGDFTRVRGSLRLDPRNVAANKVDITIPVDSVSTTNATLDGELKSADWFDAERFPTIRFVSTKVLQTGPDKISITGNLTFHGVTKPMILSATLNGSGVNPLDLNYTVGFNATTSIRRSDFGVKTLVPVVDDMTELRISAAFEKSK